MRAAHAGCPIRDSKRFFADLTAAVATVTPVPGTDSGGINHVGLSAGISFVPADGGLHAELAYGYAPTAQRGLHRGAQALALSVEIDFLEPEAKPGLRKTTRQQGLRWLFGR